MHVLLYACVCACVCVFMCAYMLMSMCMHVRVCVCVCKNVGSRAFRWYMYVLVYSPTHEHLCKLLGYLCNYLFKISKLDCNWMGHKLSFRTK